MHLLTIDQGNTRTKVGLFQDRNLRQTFSFPTRKDATQSELAQAVTPLADLPPDTRVGLCSVVPELNPAWQAWAVEKGLQLTLLTGASPTPLRMAYATPETLGPDRLMAAVAAATVATPVISISLGTATVVDAVSDDAAYLGGMITPGIGLMAESLSAAASALHPVSWQEPAHAIGRSTDESLAGGWFYLVLGGLQAMIRATRAEIGDAPLVLTGGWSAQLAPYLDGVALVDEYLVFRGIALTLTMGR